MEKEKLTCPVCGSKNVEEHQHAFWFMCRDCGYNSMPDSDREKAKYNFLTDYKSTETQ